MREFAQNRSEIRLGTAFCGFVALTVFAVGIAGLIDRQLQSLAFCAVGVVIGSVARSIHARAKCVLIISEEGICEKAGDKTKWSYNWSEIESVKLMDPYGQRQPGTQAIGLSTKNYQDVLISPFYENYTELAELIRSKVDRTHNPNAIDAAGLHDLFAPPPG